MSGFYGQDILAQVRAANDIVEVVQWLNVPLKKAGNAFRALCPFHKEKTPSFNVSAQRQSFHCFGCGAGGDVFKFLMMREGVDFSEAVRRLAERAHVSLPETDRGGRVGPSRDEKEQLYQLHLKVRDWYHANLMRSRQAEAAREYLKKRAFTAAVAKEFKLGYAPAGWDGLITWARDEKITSKLLIDAGLAMEGQRGNYDRFRDRLMIPIADEYGRVVGFSGRLLGAEAKEAKYVNSPETPIFKKGRILFGLDRSKRDLQETKTAVLCEGQLDWIRCFESGIRNVVAPQGTAFTEDQARILSRYAEEVILCFDSDPAGQKATWRNAEILIAANVSVRAAQMPEGEDPDSFIRNSGADAMKKRLREAVDVFAYKALALSRTLDMRNPRNHRNVVEEMGPLLGLVDNEPQRDRLIHNICDILKMDVQAFLAALRRPRPQGREEPSRAPDQNLDHGDYLLRLALTEKAAARMLSQHLEEKWFENYDMRQILFGILRTAKEGTWKGGWDGLGSELTDTEKQRIAKVLLHPIKISSRDIAIAIQEVVLQFQRAYLLERHESLSNLLKVQSLDDKERILCQTELLDLDRRIKQL